MTPDELLYLDRFEGGRAVIIHRREEFSIPRSLLPEGSAEGDYLKLNPEVVADARTAATEEVKRLQERLRRGGGEEA